MDGDPATRDEAALGQIHEALRLSLEAMGEEREPIEAGWALRTRSLPQVWTLNQIHVTRPVAADELLALAETHQGDLPYRHVVIEDDRLAAPVEKDMAAAGWVVDAEVVMSLVAPPDRQVDTAAVVELTEDEMLGLMRRWLLEERPGTSAQGLDQVAEYHRREGRLWEEIRFGVRDEHGAALAGTKLRTRGRLCWVEDVYTVPEARGRGVARALVTRATAQAREARPAHTFILADDHDWPKTLYRKLGFRPLGWMRTLHRS